jgi:hypothetical protein
MRQSLFGQAPKSFLNSGARETVLQDILLNVVVVVGILGLSAVITHLFARAMYVRCPACATLNARRRTHCRNCQTALE